MLHVAEGGLEFAPPKCQSFFHLRNDRFGMTSLQDSRAHRSQPSLKDDVTFSSLDGREKRPFACSINSPFWPISSLGGASSSSNR